MTEQMAYDIYRQLPEETGKYNNAAGVPAKYKQPIAQDNGKYPTYGADTGITLVNMRYDEDSPNGFGGWAFRNGYYTGQNGIAYRTAKADGNVDAEGNVMEAADPLGFTRITGFPANGILAATFNKELAYRAGNIIGNDGTWAGASGLYGIGLNTHRSPYVGRTCEYFSE